MYAAPNPKKQFKAKYDLTNYNVQLSQGDSKKLYLNPNDDLLQLNIVTFRAESVEERARWYKALSIVTAENKTAPHRPSIQNADQFSMAGEEDMKDDETNTVVDGEDVLEVAGQPLKLNTLTDISQFLSEQNNQLDSQLSVSKQAQDALIADLDGLLAQAGENNPLSESIAKVK